jgi:translation initiation factor 1 (eIF-1/SUI1)
MILRAHKKKFAVFLVEVHNPWREGEDNVAASSASNMDSSTAASAAGIAKRIHSDIKIESVEVVYRPKNDTHPMLAQLLVRGTFAKLTTGGEDAAVSSSVTERDDVNDVDDVTESDDDDDDMMNGLASGKDIRDHLRQYLTARKLFMINQEGAAATSPPLIQVDSLLRFLWPATASRDVVPDTITIKELDKVVFFRFCPMHVIRYTNASPLSVGVAGSMNQRPRLRNGDLPTVNIFSEKRSGNKTVTIVRNLESFGFLLEPIAFSWRSRFSTSVAVVDRTKKDSLSLKTGTKVPMEIHVQGPFVSQLESHLTGTLGIPKSSIALKK